MLAGQETANISNVWKYVLLEADIKYPVCCSGMKVVHQYCKSDVS
jgi:hypothetical protein